MNTTKTNKVGRPATNLIWPTGLFTIQQLHVLNSKKIRWELSARQHVERMMSKRYVSKAKETVETGKPGKPAHLFSLTKWGERKLTVKASRKNVKAPVAEPAPAVESSDPVGVVEATMNALAAIA
jgi:hypothetical protein